MVASCAQVADDGGLEFERDTEVEVDVESEDATVDTTEPVASPSASMAGDGVGQCAAADAFVPTVHVELQGLLPDTEALPTKGNLVPFRIENSAEQPAEFDVTAFVDFGTMYTHKIDLGTLEIPAGESRTVHLDLGKSAAEIEKMKYSGMMRVVARRLDTGEWSGSEPVFFHAPVGTQAVSIYSEAALHATYRGGDFRGLLAKAAMDEVGVVTTRVLDASYTPPQPNDGLESDLAPEVTP
ncbi:MAG: hypothetical protein D6705_07065 [Deltaproteobacteria bacterium]|nr:MAG: hypothetical protein D6705_07065 [Deltaproteobacteria bacterium]